MSSVALTAVTTDNFDLTLRSLIISHTFGSRWADAVLYTSETKRPVPFAVRVEKAPEITSKNGVYRWAFDHKNRQPIKGCTHHLIVSWDSWVLDPSKWNPDWLRYDYIGARWPWRQSGQNIGNSGFSLMSVRLLEALAELGPTLDIPNLEGGDDVYIGVTARPMLEEKYGIRYPDDAVADAFSYERAAPERQTFGFHGFFNFWRHCADSEAVMVSRRVAPYVVRTPEYAELMMIYYNLRKFSPLDALRVRLAEEVGAMNVTRHLLGHLGYSSPEAGQMLNYIDGK